MTLPPLKPKGAMHFVGIAAQQSTGIPPFMTPKINEIEKVHGTFDDTKSVLRY
jgi:hypothetical protein